MMKATNDQAGLDVHETIPSAGVCSWASNLHFPQYQHRPCQYKWWDKVVIQLILRSRSGQMCHSCKALLCDGSERSLCRQLGLGEMIPTQGD